MKEQAKQRASEIALKSHHSYPLSLVYTKDGRVDKVVFVPEGAIDFGIYPLQKKDVLKIIDDFFEN